MVLIVIIDRASAYDVFAPGILAQASQLVAQQNCVPNPARRGSFRIPACEDPPMQNDNSPSPDNASSPVLMVEEDRRMRRRGSQLYDVFFNKKN